MYFGIAETNDWGILYLYCLVWLCSIYHLAKLYDWLQSNLIFVAKIVRFIDNIVYYLIADITLSEDIKFEAPSANLDKTDKNFALKFYKDNNTVVSKIQIHSPLYNTICLKYRAIVTKNYCFDFPHLCINKIRVTELDSINVF